jgi:hypothetical protein
LIFDRASRVVVLGGALVCLSGCPNPNAYTVPRTLDPGDVQILFAAEAYGFTDKVTTSSTTGTSTSRVSGATPLFPTIGIRYGLIEGLDVGARIENFETLAGDLKIRLMRGRFDVAVDPGLQALVQVATRPDGSTRNSGLFYLHTPLLLGWNVNDETTIVASPGLAYSIATAPFTTGNSTEHAGAQTEVLARLGLGIDVRTSDTVSIHPEVTCMRGFTSQESFLCVAGLGLNVGAQPNYDDMSLTPPGQSQ